MNSLDVMNAKAGERAQLLLELAQGLYKEVQSQAGTSAGEVESEGESEGESQAEEGEGESEGEEENDTWVQCDECDKWRRLECKGDEVPDVWCCSMNPNPDFNTCEALEESWEVVSDKE